MDVVTVGDVMVDVRVEAAALDEGGGVHGRVMIRAAGSPSNAAVWAAEAGARARVHGRIGSDVAGALVRDELIARGVEPALAMDPSADTGPMLIVPEPGERGGRGVRGGALGPRTAPEPVQELDPTGAGDAFDGVLLANLVAGRSPGDALAAACRAGGGGGGGAETRPPRRPRRGPPRRPGA